MYGYVQYSNTLNGPNIPLIELSDTHRVSNIIQSIITQRTPLLKPADCTYSVHNSTDNIKDVNISSEETPLA